MSIRVSANRSQRKTSCRAGSDISQIHRSPFRRPTVERVKFVNGRSPGSRSLSGSAFPDLCVRSSGFVDRMTAYSCGGSRGIGDWPPNRDISAPHSRFTSVGTSSGGTDDGAKQAQRRCARNRDLGTARAFCRDRYDCRNLLLVCAPFRGIRCREFEHPPAGLFLRTLSRLREHAVPR